MIQRKTYRMVNYELLHDKVGYLASPYTAKKVDGSHDRVKEVERYQEITDIGAKLTHFKGLTLICPITTSFHLRVDGKSAKTEWKDWKSIDERLIERCSDYVLVAKMDGWKQSVGVTAEILCAKLKSIPVYYVNPVTLELEV